jgi:hypothetical protein
MIMKTKNVSIIVLLSVISIDMVGQVTEPESTLRKQNADTIFGWKKGGMTSLNFAQGSFTNWAAGGQNSIALNGFLNLFANMKSKNFEWDNALNIGYGKSKQGKANWIKSDDKLDLSSKFGLVASRNLFYAMLASFKTQMDDGYNYPNDSVTVSDFLAPAYITLAAGLDYKPNDDLSFFAAPVTLRMTIVNNQSLADAGSFGVDPATYDTAGVLLTHGKKIRNEFGGYIKLAYYKKEIFKNINFTTKFDIFSNYIKNPQNMVVSWETLIQMKINKYVSATVSTLLMYDDAVKTEVDNIQKGPRVQFKEIIGVGFSYNF